MTTLPVVSSLPGKHIYISGGAGLYGEAIALVEKMYITEIDAEMEGDTFFHNDDIARCQLPETPLLSLDAPGNFSLIANDPVSCICHN